MVDVRNFYPIQIETVLRRTTASHNQIVTVTDGRKSHSRIILHHLWDVAVGTRSLLYLLQTNDPQADWALHHFLKWRSSDHHFIQGGVFFLQLNLHIGSDMVHTVFGSQCRFIPQKRGLQAIDARRHLRNGKVSIAVGRSADAQPHHQHVHKLQRLAGGFVNHGSFYLVFNGKHFQHKTQEKDKGSNSFVKHRHTVFR